MTATWDWVLKNSDLGLITWSVLSLIAIFLANLGIGLYWQFGQRHYWFFEVLHFLGGFFMTMFFYGLYPSRGFALLALLVVTILWESLEVMIDKIPSWSRFARSNLRAESTKVSSWDTVLDVILNFSGAVAFFLLIS